MNSPSPARPPNEASVRRARAAQRAARKLSERFGENVDAAELLDDEDVASLEHLERLDGFNDDPQNLEH